MVNIAYFLKNNMGIVYYYFIEKDLIYFVPKIITYG